ncbi:hypothetical protein O181_004851 [Austropuccinia psidii MF-1]|uniref:Uncharacterized protein n=1 Tax=Austropuccinia psidii MF-1 TaxID=1389203 RepID=A0A9Q3BGB4_9BASI|nr:hypothetical protein [Austropuccinia psidii MF-1]
MTIKDFPCLLGKHVDGPGLVDTWTRHPMGYKIFPEDSREDRTPKIPVGKLHKCGSTSPVAIHCTKKTKINELQVIEVVQCAEDKESFDQDSAVSEDTPQYYYPVQNITAFFEVTESHNHLPQYQEDCYNLTKSTRPECARINLLGAKFTLQEHLV